MIEEVLVDFLQDSGLTVYPDSIPAKGSYPCVVYQRISTPLIRTHEGNALQYPRFQLTCWGNGASGKADALQTADTVKSVLDLNQINFMLVTKEGEFDVNEPEPNLYRRILDFYIWSEAE